MDIYKSKTWIEDLDRTLYSLRLISSLVGKSVLITGINGLIGSAIADLLIRYNETHDKTIRIVAAARSEQSVKNRFRDFFERPYFEYEYYDATEPNWSTVASVDYIIHGASNSSPDILMADPVETMLSNFIGLYELLKFARSKQVVRVLYISSSEVYGQKEDDAPYKEDQYGYIDLLNVRNSYSIGKCAAETLCASFSDEYGVDTVIVRPGHIYGPTAKRKDKHVSSEWAYQAADKKDIVMKSDGMQLRSYCYCLDAVSAILTVLLKGKNKNAYNISNPNSIISIKQMAELISTTAGVGIKMDIPSYKEKRNFNPMNNSSLDSKKLENLGWKGYFDANIGFEHTIKIIRDISK